MDNIYSRGKMIVVKAYNRVKRKGIRDTVLHIWTIIWRNKIPVILAQMVAFFSKNKQLKDTIIIRSHTDFDSNGGAFYNYLIEEGYNDKYKIVWLLGNPKPMDLKLPSNVEAYYSKRPDIRMAYAHGTAKYMLYDDAAIKRVRGDQIVGYLTHGTFSLKAPKGKINASRDLNFILTASEFAAPIAADIMDFPYPNDIQIILGYPLHDVLYTSQKGDLDKITGGYEYTKVILWMPTFRKHLSDRNDSSVDLPLGVPVLRDKNACIRLNNILKEENTLLIAKIHPMQDLSMVKLQNLSNITVLDINAVKRMGIDTYRLMKDVDALISDYSSSAYDFLHLNRPIGFTMDDVKEYKLGLVFDDPFDYMPGQIIYNEDDFMEFVKNVVSGRDSFVSKRKKVFDLIFKYHDGESSKRLAEYLGLNR